MSDKPEQLMLDLNVVPVPLDDNAIWSETKFTFLLAYELTPEQWNEMSDGVIKFMDEHWPSVSMSGTIKRTPNKDLH